MYTRKLNKLFNDEEYEDVIKLADEAINNIPSFFVYYESKAKACFEICDYLTCLNVIEKGLKIKSDSVVLNKLKKSLDNNKQAKNWFCGRSLFLPNYGGNKRLEGGVRLKRKSKLKKIESESLVSIVTVVYNNPNSLERCMRSVFEQTYDNVEYIIIDGGSDKATLNIIEKYADSIEYFVSEPDKGIYNAMNKGISVAQGDYVCLLNSDDFYKATFVEDSIKNLNKTSGEISYCNYQLGDNLLTAEVINPGVLLGHLNICHNTFLVSKEAYNIVGPYNEKLRIISDAVWIRKAFKLGLSFSKVDKNLFTLVEGGLSSGTTPEHRELFINEVAQSYVLQFPFLSMEEAEELYLFRFNNKRLSKVLDMSDKYKSEHEFLNALKLYVQYCFQSRNNFKLSHKESDGLFLSYLRAVEVLGVDLLSIRINTKNGCLSEVLTKLSLKLSKNKKKATKTVLHFVSVFSAPSETFIYDLLNRLQDKTHYDNFVLYEHEKLSEERPYDNKLYVPWSDFRPEIRDQIYKFIFKKLSPNLVIAHFAINEWKFYKRITPLGIRIPTLTMTHGIDVFNLKSEPEYKKYIIDSFCNRNDTKFTTVSDYLYGELVAQGVPESKITKIHNVANYQFLEHRKKTNYFDYTRTLNLLTVGRCIDWKGHIDLLHGLRTFIDKYYSNTKLSIVYGNGVDNLSQVKFYIEKLELNNNVELIPFVDFSVEKDYFSRFDIYIQASKYTNDNLRKSETFGVASLEAILSGLPIIVTNAGGLPEVVGNQGKFSKIVRHTSGTAIANALKEFFEQPETFSDNIEYANHRLAYFSEEKQIKAMCKEIDQLTKKSIKVAMFSTSTIQGAGYAAYRLFKGLRDYSSIEPTLFTTVRNHENEEYVNVVRHPSGDGKGWQAKQKPNNSKPGMTIFTINDNSISNEQLWEWVKDTDVINIHWTARYLSVENIAYLSNLNKPLVMTIRDMQPITGGCHFFHGCDKWKSDCSDCPQLYDNLDDLPRKVINSKRNTYNFNNITLVALSNHTKSILEQAPKFKNCRIEVIANSIETDVFKPTDTKTARELLGLPQDRKIIGYVPSFASEVKGYKELAKAFELISNDSEIIDKPMVMLVGNKTPADEEISLDKISLGYISDNEKLALAYSAADIVVVPSLEETFSNTTAEAIACGTPVVGFKTGAIPDLAKDGVTGFSYEVGDWRSLSTGIQQLLKKEKDVEKLREFACKALDFNIQPTLYEKLYSSLILKN